MVRLRQQGQREAKRIWNRVSPDNLDGTFNVGALTLTVSTLQREAARLSSAYLASFIASELGEPERPPALSVWDKTFGGNPLREGLRSAVITTKQKIKDGADPTEATRGSRDILVSDVGLFIDTAARESLRQGMEQDDRIVGYQRAITGTCGACAGDTEYQAFSENAPVVPLNVHPNCECVAEPVVSERPTKSVQPEAGISSSLRGMVQQAAGEVESVHSYPAGLTRIKAIAKEPVGGAKANYLAGHRGGGVLQLGSRADVDTVLHELGHAVDYALGPGKSWASYLDDASPLMEAIKGSPAYGRLQSSLMVDIGEGFEYWGSPRELFARAYYQWIRARVGGDAPRYLDIENGIQWKAKEFEPIAREFENFFRKKGLLK